MNGNPNDINNYHALTVDRWEEDRKALIETLTESEKSLQEQLAKVRGDLARLGVTANDTSTPAPVIKFKFDAAAKEMLAEKHSVSEKQTLPERIQEALSESPMPLSAPDIQFCVNHKKPSVSAAFIQSTLGRMLKAGKIERSGDKGKYLYSLA